MKRLGLITALVMLLTFSLYGCGEKKGTPGGETYEFKIAHLQSEGSAGADAFTYLKKILEERTDGKIKVTIYGDKSMAGGDTELAEICRQNTVQCVPVPTHTLSALADVPEYKVFELPYLFTDWEEIYTVLDSDIAAQWAQALADEAGVVVCDGLVKGWLSIGTKKGPVNVPSDLKGVKVRTMSTDMQMGLIEAFGASPTIVSYGELYTALQQGTVDGALTATSLFETDRFCEVISHLSVVRATAHFHLPIVNKSWLDSLPEELRTIFDECMEEYVAKARMMEKEADQAVIKKLEKDEGVKVRQYSEAELKPFKEAAREMFEKYENSPGEGVVDEVLDLLEKDRDALFE